MNKEPDSWITINGQHVPIFEGEGKREAVSRFLNKKTSRVERNKDKYDTINKYKKRKATNKLDEDNFEYRGNKQDFKKMVQVKDNRYIVVRNDETEEEALNKYKERENINNIERIKQLQDDDRHLQNGTHINRNDEQEMKEAKQNKGKLVDYNRRESLINFTQNNREQIDKWVSEYDDETDKRVLDKISKGQGLSLKEYYGYIARRPKEGDIIFGGGKHGEDVRIKNGKREIIKDYQRKKRSNK